MSFRSLKDISPGSYIAEFRALERTGSCRLFGIFGFGYVRTQTQNALDHEATIRCTLIESLYA